MTQPLREKFANQAETTLNGAINSSVTSIVVANGAVFPSTGNFRIFIDTELMICTARSGNTLTVIRGAETSTMSSHANGANVSLQVSTGALETWLKDSVPLGNYKKPLAKIVADDGSTVLTASSFTWVNQGGAAVTDQSGTILMRVPSTANGTDFRIQERTTPGTPWIYDAAFHFCGPRGGSDDFPHLLFGVRENSTGKLSFIQYGTSSDESARCSVSHYTNLTTFSSNVRTLRPVGLIGSELWLRLEDDATNVKVHIGHDGINWSQLATFGRTSFMSGGPDRIFWGGYNGNNTVNDALVRLLHWSRA